MNINFWINVALGIIIGSYLATFFPSYRNTFEKIMRGIANRIGKKKG